MTHKLYWDAPHADAFDARVVAHGDLEGRPSVILEATLFYPEAGGQMADWGTLGDAPVRDVQVDAEGRIHHVVDELPAVGSLLAGRIDRSRRREHMALHTGQHMLSRALLDLGKAPTVSSRLGESGATLDVDRVLSAKTLAAVEARVGAPAVQGWRVAREMPARRERTGPLWRKGTSARAATLPTWPARARWVSPGRAEAAEAAASGRSTQTAPPAVRSLRTPPRPAQGVVAAVAALLVLAEAAAAPA